MGSFLSHLPLNAIHEARLPWQPLIYSHTFRDDTSSVAMLPSFRKFMPLPC